MVSRIHNQASCSCHDEETIQRGNIGQCARTRQRAEILTPGSKSLPSLPYSHVALAPARPSRTKAGESVGRVAPNIDFYRPHAPRLGKRKNWSSLFFSDIFSFSVNSSLSLSFPHALSQASLLSLVPLLRSQDQSGSCTIQR